MPIFLNTGLPGHGKTLFTVDYIKRLSEREKRPVYYHNIKNLTLPWTVIDPVKWMDVPPNSIIVIDEAQDIYRPRPTGAAVPAHEAALEKHRHGGVDIYLITQHPMLISNGVRRLVDQHRHIVRKWGTQSATVHQWQGVKPNCEQPAARVDSEKTSYGYPKMVFNYYKSAEVHTVKRQIPKRVFFLGFLRVSLVALIYGGYRVINSRFINRDNAVASSNSPGVSAETARLSQSDSGKDSGKVKRASYKDAVDDAKQYIFDRTPRVVGLVATAPRYDEITKATVAPVPAACVSSSSKGCNCYSQQGTVLAVPVAMCSEIVAHGFFQDFDTGSAKNEKQPMREQSQSVVAASAVPVAVHSVPAPAPVAVLSADGYGVLGKRGGGG